MNSKSKLVDERFPLQFNCAQTVFSLFANDLGIDEDIAFKITSGFGGGMKRGATCGAVTAAYMVLGLKYANLVNDSEEKAKMEKLIKQFNQLFIEKHGSLNCKDLIHYDISTPEGKEAAKAAGIVAEVCPNLIKSACNILENEF